MVCRRNITRYHTKPRGLEPRDEQANAIAIERANELAIEIANLRGVKISRPFGRHIFAWYYCLMNTKIVVVGTEKSDIFLVAVTDLDPHEQAGDFREIIGTFPRELANAVAQREGESRSLPVILNLP